MPWSPHLQRTTLEPRPETGRIVSTLSRSDALLLVPQPALPTQTASLPQQPETGWHTSLAPRPSAHRVTIKEENQNRQEALADDWLDNEAPDLPQRQGNFNANFAPLMRLEPFNGDSAKWPDFIAGFKALIHDVVPTE